MKFVQFTTLCLILVVCISGIGLAQTRTIEGKGEEYHHAMYLNFKHAADQAQALFTQANMPNTLVMEIAREHVDEIWVNLERARVQHAMIHKTYGEDETRMIMENHENLLNAHLAAMESCKLLKTEIGKKNPDRESIKRLSGMLYAQASKAAVEHMDGMKKLGLGGIQVPS